MASFTDENDEFLVELIAKNPPLYDSRLKTYKDNVVRDNIWEHIGTKLNKTNDDCKKRWRSIRDSYQRIRRKNKLPTGSATVSKSKKWSLLERLNFLENVPTERKTICNIETANDPNDSENEVTNDGENCFNKDKEINVESNDIEMNSAGTSGSLMVSVPTSGTDETEVNIEETADEEQNKKARRFSGGILKKKKQSQNSTVQAALLQYWKERDTERRAQIQALTLQPTSNQEQDPDVDAWVLGWFMCKVVPYVQGVSVSASVYSLIAVSLDRFLAIWWPLKCQITTRRARIILVLIWAYAIIVPLPWLFFFDLVPVFKEDDTLFCLEVWPDYLNGNIYFMIFNVILGYIVPMIMISMCYILIWVKVWKRTIPTDNRDAQMERIQQSSKVKVIKMLVVVIITFIVSWLPLYVIFTRIKFGGELEPWEENLLPILAPFAQFLGTANSSINPILYAFFNNKYRQGFAIIIQSRECCSTLRYYDSVSMANSSSASLRKSSYYTVRNKSLNRQVSQDSRLFSRQTSQENRLLNREVSQESKQAILSRQASQDSRQLFNRQTSQDSRSLLLDKQSSQDSKKTFNRQASQDSRRVYFEESSSDNKKLCLKQGSQESRQLFNKQASQGSINRQTTRRKPINRQISQDLCSMHNQTSLQERRAMYPLSRQMSQDRYSIYKEASIENYTLYPLPALNGQICQDTKRYYLNFPLGKQSSQDKTVSLISNATGV